MHATMYAVNGMPEWADIAHELRSSESLEPVYWLAPGRLESSIREGFPDTVYHDSKRAHRGLPAAEYRDSLTRPLDQETLTDYQGYKLDAMRMMDRMDVAGSFGYYERERHFHHLLMYWQNVVDDLAPDVVIYDSSPHTPAHYTLYAVCNVRDVPMLMLTETRIPRLFYVRSHLYNSPDDIRTAYQRVLDEGETPSPGHQEYVDSIRAETYETIQPAFTKHDVSFSQKYARRLMKVQKWPRYVYSLLFEGPTTYLKPRGGRVTDELSHVDSILADFRSEREKKRLRRTYDQLAEWPTLDQPYVYVALHFQPERASVPEGGVYGDQFLLVNLLAEVTPDDWSVLVKEHPDQFLLKYRGEQGRDPFFYEELAELDGVAFVDQDCDQFELIDGAKAVATVTGTAGWESVVRGTPSLVFGNAWYRDCKGVYHVKTEDDVMDAIDAIEADHTVDEHAVDAFVRALEDVGYEGELTWRGRSDNPDSAIYRTNVENISRCLANHIDL